MPPRNRRLHNLVTWEADPNHVHEIPTQPVQHASQSDNVAEDEAQTQSDVEVIIISSGGPSSEHSTVNSDAEMADNGIMTFNEGSPTDLPTSLPDDDTNMDDHREIMEEIAEIEVANDEIIFADLHNTQTRPITDDEEDEQEKGLDLTDPDDPPAPSSPSSLASSSSSLSCSSSQPLAEVISFGRTFSDPPPLLIAMGLLFEITRGSRSSYNLFREVMKMQDPDLDIPRKLDTLKKIVRCQIPLLTLLRRQVTVTITKQPTLPAQSKLDVENRHLLERKTWLYWYDPIKLCQTILQSDLPLFFGLGHFTENDTEFWQSPSWRSSALACSGQFVQALNGDIIFPGDIIRLSETVRLKNTAVTYNKARVLEVGRSFRRNSQQGDVYLRIHPVVNEKDPITEIHIQRRLIEGEYLILSAPKPILLPANMAREVLDIIIDYESTEDEPIAFTDFFIQRQYELYTNQDRYLRFTHPTRAELEIREFGRDVIEAQSQQRMGDVQVRSLPFLLFIDAFGAYRNMYRSLLAFYMIPAAMDYTNRRKVANCFTITMSPHGASLDSVTQSLEPAFRSLHQGVKVDVRDVPTLMIAFPIVIIGDMPQQADNAGFLRHNANIGCRFCMCPKGERHDIRKAFDIRTHFDTYFVRQHAATLPPTAQAAFLTAQGLRSPPSPVMPHLAPALDIVVGLGIDTPHSEWRGLGSIIHAVLLSGILSNVGRDGYLRSFQTFKFPRGWHRIQSPVQHIKSWSMSEAGRASLLIPLILRTHARSTWYRLAYLNAVAASPSEIQDADVSPTNTVIRNFCAIAYHNYLSGSNHPQTPGQVDRDARKARQAYIELVNWAEVSSDRRSDTVSRITAVNNDADDADDADDPDLADPDAAFQLITADPDIDGDNVAPETSATRVPARTRANRRTSRFHAWKSTLNVHIGQHLAEITEQYASVFNCNVLAGELRHKLFRRDIDFAAPSNLMAFIFSRDLVRQSIRLGLAGAWSNNLDHTAIVQKLADIKASCPRLIDSFLPKSERDLTTAAIALTNELDQGTISEEEDEEEDTQRVIEDDSHRRVNLSLRGFALGSSSFNISSSTKLSTLPRDHTFLAGVRAALSSDYKIRHVVNFPKTKLRWFQRLSFTDQYQTRWVFNIGDQLEVDVAGTLRMATLLQLFTIRIHDQTLSFSIIALLNHVTTNDGGLAIDPVLEMPVFSWSRTANLVVVGLPALQSRNVYCIPAPAGASEPWYVLDDDDERHIMIQCVWRVDYM